MSSLAAELSHSMYGEDMKPAMYAEAVWRFRGCKLYLASVSCITNWISGHSCFGPMRSSICNGKRIDTPLSDSSLLFAASLSRLRAAATESSIKPVPGRSALPFTR